MLDGHERCSPAETRVWRCSLDVVSGIAAVAGASARPGRGWKHRSDDPHADRLVGDQGVQRASLCDPQHRGLRSDP